MVHLTERQKLILALVIRDYIEEAQPVSSNKLVNQYNLDVSSATVRNEMGALTEKGFLRQPHTSAGRAPTEEGYRYFVHDVDRWMRLAASVLAQHSQAASLVTAPQPEDARFKHLELIGTRGRQVLMVLVLGGGDVRQQMLTLAEPVVQEQLSSAAAKINSLCDGMKPDSISALTGQFDALEQDILKLVSEAMHHSQDVLVGEVYREGITHVLSEPEFAEVEEARNALLRIYEERSLLQDLLSRTVMTGNVGVEQVLIGGEGTWEELRDCSVVLARYGAPGLATGTLGVLGPIRMAYGQSISTVRYVAGLLSDLVIDLHSE
jgi:heat-inducible transcriptional repressor